MLTATMGSSISRPKYFFFCSALPAIITGVCPNPVPSIANRIPVQPKASSSVTKHESKTPSPRPPIYEIGVNNTSGRWFFSVYVEAYHNLVEHVHSSNPMHELS